MKMHSAPSHSKALFFTGNRSEFGLLSPLIELLAGSDFDVTVMIAGDHHSAAQGFTKSEIDCKGTTTVDLPYDDSCTDNCTKIAYLVSRVSAYLNKNSFNYVILYGDRYETFATAIAAHQHNIKIVHLEGGDITEGGVQDDSIRHAISKLATFHLPSNTASAKNLMQLGEEPWRVHSIGLSVNGFITNENYSKGPDLVAKYTLDDRPVILFTIHPLPASASDTEELVDESLAALLQLDPGKFNIIVTHPNSDPLHELILQRYQRLVGSSVRIVPSLGRRDFHGLLALNKQGCIHVVCAGNSSSGIKEAGFFHCVTLNIGERQKSRLCSGLVFNCPPDRASIVRTLDEIVAHGFYQDQAAQFDNPYYSEISMEGIATMLLSYSGNSEVLKKKFFITEQTT
jgi:UDP-hydrolysing UDP-N-acetyl-D-glucosamine 2-epimerase